MLFGSKPVRNFVGEPGDFEGLEFRGIRSFPRIFGPWFRSNLADTGADFSVVNSSGAPVVPVWIFLLAG